MQSTACPMLAVACTNDRDRFRVRHCPFDGRLNPERSETGSQQFNFLKLYIYILKANEIKRYNHR